MNYLKMLGLVLMNEAGAAGDAGGDAGGGAAAGDAAGAAQGDAGAAAAGAGSQPASLLGGEAAAAGQEGQESGDAGEGQQQAGAPEAYEAFAVPEGYELHEAAVPMLQEMFKELNLPQDKANALVAKLIEIDNARNPTPEQIQQAQEQRITQLNEAWGKQCRELPDLGGENFDKSLQVCSTVMTKFGTPEVRQLLTYSGLGSNPHFFKFVHAIGMSMQEDTMVHGGEAAGARKSDAEVFYGKQQ